MYYVVSGSPQEKRLLYYQLKRLHWLSVACTASIRKIYSSPTAPYEKKPGTSPFTPSMKKDAGSLLSFLFARSK